MTIPYNNLFTVVIKVIYFRTLYKLYTYISSEEYGACVKLV